MTQMAKNTKMKKYNELQAKLKDMYKDADTLLSIADNYRERTAYTWVLDKLADMIDGEAQPLEPRLDGR